MRSSRYFKTISRILILAMLHLCWLTSYGYAEMVPTESAIRVQDDRQRLLDLLERQEVIEELEKYGISKVEAVARINSLTDEEVTMIAGKLDELAEGGSYELSAGIIVGLGMAFLVFFSMVVCAIKEPYCWIFDCDMSWNDCVKGVSRSGREWSGHGSGDEGGYLDTSVGSERGQCVSPCYTKFSDCMGKVTGVALTEGICMEERGQCLQSCEGFIPLHSNFRYKSDSDCTSQFGGCMGRASSQYQEDICHEEKQMCLQEFSSCNIDYSSCLQKVGGSALIKRYCMEEKQKCIQSLEISKYK
jgi:Family of unknown function (DUF6627)